MHRDIYQGPSATSSASACHTNVHFRYILTGFMWWLHRNLSPRASGLSETAPDCSHRAEHVLGILLTFHCKVSELLLLCASLGGKGHSGAQLWVVKLTGSEQDPLTELYMAYTLQRKRTGRMSVSTRELCFRGLPELSRVLTQEHTALARVLA